MAANYNLRFQVPRTRVRVARDCVITVALWWFSTNASRALRHSHCHYNMRETE